MSDRCSAFDTTPNTFVRFSIFLLMLIHGLLLGWIAYINAPMYDEIAHLSAGLSHWQYGNFDLYKVNPPLMRMIATIPLLIAQPRTDWHGISEIPFARSEFGVGQSFMTANGEDSFWYFTVCRWMQIPISLLGGWICYCWSRDIFGRSSGLYALALWVFCPNILAWGSTLTPDLGATTFGLAAGYRFWLWLKSPSWVSTAYMTGMLALAELSKSTWIFLFIIWPMIWGGWRLFLPQAVGARPPLLQLVCALAGALYLMNAGYGFEGSFQRLGSFSFISHSLSNTSSAGTAGNRFSETGLADVPIPLPANYVRGIDLQKYDFENEKWSYLRGEQKQGGWYWYYLYAIFVKTPVCYLLVFLFALLSNRIRTINLRNIVVLGVIPCFVVALVSSQTGFNRYARYALPAIPFVYILVSLVVAQLQPNKNGRAILAWGLLGLGALESLLCYPHSMSFFNQIAGGPFGGPAHLLDANIDWGQDLLELKRFVDRHPEAVPLHLAYFGLADPMLASSKFAILNTSGGASRQMFSPGWYAISVNHLYGYRHFDSDAPQFVGFRQIKPRYYAGYSIYIYDVTESDLKNIGLIKDK